MMCGVQTLKSLTSEFPFRLKIDVMEFMEYFFFWFLNINQLGYILSRHYFDFTFLFENNLQYAEGLNSNILRQAAFMS